MREININIEGYNVNGICVGCLNYNRNMFYTDEATECFKTLAEIDVPDGLSIQVCWECLAYVRQVKRFQEQILRSYDILIDYSSKQTFLNSPQDLSLKADQRLRTTEPSVLSISKESETDIPDDHELKKESNIDVELTDFKIEIDDDYLQYDLEPKPESQYHQEAFQDNVTSSDEDIQLSKLKKKKNKREKKVKKKKKTSVKPNTENKVADTPKPRKLKNLPPDLVELYTMTEEEMWENRKESVTSPEFTKLRYRCDKCIIGFNTEKLMLYHQDTKHKPKPGACQFCDVCQSYLLTKDNLSAHRALHLSAYKCKQCALVTTLKRAMMKHLRVHTQDIERYACNACDKEFSTKSKLAYHKSVSHQDRPQCDCCGKVFANKMTLKYHLKLLPQNKEEKPKEKMFIPCNGCNKVFPSKKSYRAHVVIHDGLSYPCSVCGKLFQWKRNLARHMRNHRDKDAGALHECRECGKTFSSRDCYNNHMKLSKKHVPEDLYTHACNYCGKRFPTKWCMVDHIDWDHLKRIKYQCNVCLKPFKTAKIMVAHMNNIHEGRKNKEPDGAHLCEICGKSYKTVKRLKGHVWAMHTKRSTAKSFKCKYCPATFTWQTSIYKHTKMMHHNKRPKQTRPPPVKKQEYTEMEYYNMLPLPITERTNDVYPVIPN